MGDASNSSSSQPAWEDKMWDSYNFLMTCPDTSRLRKLLARHELFKMTLDIPGDIVECGVFKGTGLMQFLKLRQIYIPNSNKKVIGFDLFHTQPKLSGNDNVQMSALFKEANFTGIDPEELKKAADETTRRTDSMELIAGDVTITCKEVIGFDLFHTQPKLSGNDNVQMSALFKEANFTGIDPEELKKAADETTRRTDSMELIAGDVTITCKEYAETRPGFRISFLHMDLDVETPTLKALEALWPKVCRGGVVVFDEYAISRWSESNAVDKFFEDQPNQKLRTLPWATTPTAYIIKE